MVRALALVLVACGGISEKIEPACELATYTVPLSMGAVVVSGGVLSADTDPNGCTSAATCYDADGSGVVRVWQNVGGPDGFRLSYDRRGCP